MGFMQRNKDRDWTHGEMPDTWAHVPIVVLQDIRDELQKLNRLLHCVNFIGIPNTLRRIARNTTKPKRKRPKIKARKASK